MINVVIGHIVTEINAYFNVRTAIDDRVVADVLLHQDGKENTQVKDKVVCMLVNVAEDRVGHSVEAFQRRADNRFEKVLPEVKVNLFLLFVANLSDYDEALKSLSYVVSFFQRVRYIDYAEVPGLSDREGRLIFELQTMSFEQINHLWGALGAKYAPSVLYRVRLTIIRDEQVEGVVAPVREIHIDGGVP